MPESHYSNTKVVELFNKDFSSDKGKLRVKKDGFRKNFGVVKFYAPWCPHCTNMVRDLTYLADELKEYNVRIAAVNCDDKNKGNDKLAARAKIEGLPTLFMLREDGTLKKYEGSRSVEGILTAIVKTAKKRTQN